MREFLRRVYKVECTRGVVPPFIKRRSDSSDTQSITVDFLSEMSAWSRLSRSPKLAYHDAPLNSVVFSPDAKFLASSGVMNEEYWTWQVGLLTSS